MVELRWFDRAASITVTTVMLKTTVTPSAITSAKPRWSCSTRRKRFVSRVMASDPRAVPEKDGVLELIRTDARPLDAHPEVDLQRGEAEAAGDVREDRKDVSAGQIVGDLHARCGVAR